jgi:hypothetical protein
MRISPVAMAVLVSVASLPSASSKKASIRQIDFKNFSIPWDDETAAPPSDLEPLWHWLDRIPEPRISLVNGLHHFYKPSQSQFERDHAPLLRMVSVTYGDLDADGAGEAAVHLNYTEGGTSNWDYLYVYKMVHSQPKVMSILEGGSRAYGGLTRAAIQNGLLVLDFADPDRRVGDCCSEGYIRARYRWTNGKFVENGPRERGNLDLHAR